MKKSLIIWIIIILSVLSGILFFVMPLLLTNPILTGQTINNEENLSEYTYTKAICNEKNYCEDNEIKCRGNEIISVTPITGAAVQFSENWEDPRDSKINEKLC